ncbi:amino acid/polyamine transporter I [Leptodontidium sp. 2 PMI_412]|nr:amino acid/polyamine transporter I [Leptodontidium sp. 2 PMI_412]
MGLGHSISNTAITLITGLASSISWGGPPFVTYGFIMMAIVATFVAISLGELASTMPHSGGQYFWVATLAPPKYRRFLSYITGILGWAGAVCTSASCCLAVPLMVFSIITLRNPEFDMDPWMVFLSYQVINLVAFFFNLFERGLPWISKSLLVYTITSLVVILVSILAASPNKQSAENVFFALNGPNWAFSCLDAVTHLADEIPNPRVNIPKALLVTMALGSFTGLTVLALFFYATDLKSVFTSGTPSLQIFSNAFSGNTAAAIALQTLVAYSVAGAMVGVHTWQIRMAWAFSKDKGFPFHSRMSRLAPEPFGTPIWAHIWSCGWTAVLGFLYLGSQTAFNSLISAGILLQYLTYSASILCLLSYGGSNIRHGPFWFPSLGFVANIITVSWTFISLVFYSFPIYLPVLAEQMNYVSCVIVGVFLYAVGYWVLFGRNELEVPKAQGYE